MALVFGDAVSSQHLDALTKSVQFRASRKLNDADCQDIAGQVILEAYVASQGDPEAFRAIASARVGLSSYYQREVHRVERTRSVQSLDELDSSESGTRSVATPLRDPSVLSSRAGQQGSDEAPVRLTAKRSLASAGVDMSPMDVFEIADLINRLDETLRESFSLWCLGHSIADIAEMTNVHASTISRKVAKARAILQEQYTAAQAA